MRLLGVPVSDNDARRIATTLMAGDEIARTLSARMVNGLQRHVTVLALSPDERDRLGVLEDPPDSLSELRGRLADDLAYRRGFD